VPDRSAQKWLFENLFPNDDSSRHPNIVRPSLLLKQRGAKWYDYVVLENATLVIGERMASKGHANLAEGRKVAAAGGVQVIGGQIVVIDNASGHYLPKGKKAQKAALDAFRKCGFSVSDNGYIEKVFNNKTRRWSRRR